MNQQRTKTPTFILLGFLLLFATASYANAQKNQPGRKKTQFILEKMANRIVRSTTYRFVDPKTGKTYSSVKGLHKITGIKAESQYNDWHYTNGVLNIGMEELGKVLHNKTYRDYSTKNFDFIFNHGALPYFHEYYNQQLKKGWSAIRKVNWYMFFRMVRLDDYGTMGASLIDVYHSHPESVYKSYIDQVALHLLHGEPRLSDETISRYWPHENTIWADDLYMSVAFLARMGKLTGDHRYYDDAIRQIIRFDHYLWCPEKQIYYHCYYTDTHQNGVAHWARANGWIFMAQADLLEVLPINYPGRDKVLAIFQKQAAGIALYQSPEGLWHQLLDKNDSYTETSASAMFVFGLARGVNQGWLDQDYSSVADSGWQGILSKIDDQGDIKDICVGTGIMPSLSFYYHRPTATNIPMGEGPVLRAGAEILQMKKYHELPASTKYNRIFKEFTQNTKEK